MNTDVIFSGLAFATLPGLVMTPRPASEQLVTAVLDRVGDRDAVVADVGTGSGAIAVAIAARSPRTQVWAVDTSASAALLARANVLRHGLAERVTVRKGDLLAPVPGPIDVVVANLPYLPLAEASLHDDLRDEPASAIFAPGDGLEHYRRLIASARERLAPDGALVLQLRRRVLTASRDQLDRLARDLTLHVAA
jgi:release factor glutamine methyltransferase